MNEDKVMRFAAYAFVGLVVLMVVGIIWFGCTHHCTRSHRGMVAQTICTGGKAPICTTTVSEQDICDEWEKD